MSVIHYINIKLKKIIVAAVRGNKISMQFHFYIGPIIIQGSGFSIWHFICTLLHFISNEDKITQNGWILNI